MKKILLLLVLPVLCFSNFPDINSEKTKKPKCKLIAGNSNPELFEKVAKHLDVELCKSNIKRFNDGEVSIHIEESIRGQDVFIMQSTCSTNLASINDNILELYLLIRACKRACVKSITAVIPYFGYARQDRKTESRVPISASDISMLVENAGADHVISIDLHCGQIQGFFHNIPVDNLMTSVVFIPYFAKKKFNNLVVIAPDAGAVERAKNFISGLKEFSIDANLAIIIKQRKEAGSVDRMNLVGDVDGCDVLIVDDMCDTGGTLVRAAKELKDRGANRIYACITHPVFSKNAIERIRNSVFDEIIVTDTIPLKEKAPYNLKQISISPLIAEAIRRSSMGDSLSYLFEF